MTHYTAEQDLRPQAASSIDGCICAASYLMCEDGHAINCPCSNQFAAFQRMTGETTPGAAAEGVELRKIAVKTEATRLLYEQIHREGGRKVAGHQITTDMALLAAGVLETVANDIAALIAYSGLTATTLRPSSQENALALVKRMADRETDAGGCLDITAWLIEADRIVATQMPLTNVTEYKSAWEALSTPLAWMHDSARLKSYWGWNLADIANDLIDKAYPGLRADKAVGTAEGQV